MQVTLPAQRVHTLRVLWLMSRPSNLLLIVGVYLVGIAMALAQGAALELASLAFGVLPLLLVSTSIHYANEYADHETDALTTRTPFSGGSGALLNSGLSPGLALRAARLSLVLSGLLAFLGFFLGWMGSLALTILGLGAVLGWTYSLPPLALAWNGWGELANALAGGMALPLFGYTVLAGRLELWVVAGCLPFVALVFLSMLATTWPDRSADAAVGKNTLAVLWPAGRLRSLYWGVAALFLVSLPLLVGWSLPPAVAWSSYLVAPLLLIAGGQYTRQRSPLAAVAAMVSMVFIQFAAWLSTLA